MKFLAGAIVFLMSVSGFARDCSMDQTYRDLGWKVHPSSQFESYLAQYSELIEKGLEGGTMVEDLNGRIITRRTHDGKGLLMTTISWDALATERDLMFGDYAIFSSHENPDVFVEVRWFDGEKRHVVYNDKLLACVSIIPPMAVNSIF